MENKLEFDIVVAGGGLAGICAAISAARQKTNVAIISDRPVLGGPSSSEIKVPPSGGVLFNGWTETTGIIEEIILEDRAINHAISNSIYDNVILNQIKSHRNIKIFLGHTVFDIIYKDSNIEGYKTQIYGVKVIETASAVIKTLHANQFIDCTGDGVLAYLSGAAYRYGREARAEFNEALAPVTADRHTMGSSILYEAADTGTKSPFIAPVWVQRYEKKDFEPDRNPIEFKGNKLGGYWWMEVCGEEYDQCFDNQKIKIELYRHIYGVWDYLKNKSEHKDKLSTYSISWIGSVLGKRESRRIEGDVVLTEDDCRNSKEWYDSVVTANWFIDLHTIAGVNNRKYAAEMAHIDDIYSNYTLIPPFNIPLRCLYSKDIENLWMAGRDISVSHCALGALRVQKICANMGQAVGTAASVCIIKEITPRQCANTKAIKEVQQILLKDDIHIIGLNNDDKNDIVRQAEVKISSELPLIFGKAKGYVDLSVPRAQILPITSEHIDNVELLMKNTSNNDVNIRLKLGKVQNIWDTNHGNLVCSHNSVIKGMYEGFVEFNLNIRNLSEGAYRLSIACDNNGQNIFWAKSDTQPTGTLAQYYFTTEGGIEDQNKDNKLMAKKYMDIPAFSVWNQYKRKGFSHVLKVEPLQFPYGAKSLKSNKNHPEVLPNLWISDEIINNQYIELDFGESKSFNTIHLYFDTNLNSEHSVEKPYWKAQECVKEYKIYVYHDDWNEVYHKKDNYQRLNICCIGEQLSRRVMVEIISTNGIENARVYGISIY